MQKILVIILILNYFLFSQGNFQRESSYFGSGLVFGQNQHSAAFSELPGVPGCCPEFTDGSGFGLAGRFFSGFAINNKFYFEASVGYKVQNALLESTEATEVRLPSGEFAEGAFVHNLDASLSSIFLEPSAVYTIYGFNVGLGYRIGFLSAKTFEQSEVLSEPVNTGAFYNEETGEIIGRTRNERSGEIPDAVSLQHGFSLNLSYDFQLNENKSWWISPNFNYYYGISEFVSGTSWQNQSIAAGISIKYSRKNKLKLNKNIIKIDTVEITEDFIAKNYVKIGKEIKNNYKETIGDTIFTIREISRTDTLVIQGKKPVIDYAKDTKPEKYTRAAGELDIIGLDSLGNPIPFENINLLVELTREIYPLLPYVFFDENSEVIPERYNKISNAGKFDESQIRPSPINYHRNNLNIIGKRLADNPNSEITVYGYIDPTTEQNCKLAEWRALAVKKYILNNFAVNEDQIKIVADEENCFPSDRTRTKSKEGYAENRRVVIETNTPELLFAVSRAKYQEPKLTEPSTIIIDLKANLLQSNEPIAKDFDPYKQDSPRIKSLAPVNWELIVSQGNNILLDESQNTNSAEFPVEITRYNAKELNNLEPIKVDLKVFDNFKNIKNYSEKIPIKKDTAEIEVEKLTLTIFEVSQADLNNRIKKEINKFVDKLGSDSEINITGYSDDLGSAKANKSLSAVRAEEVKKYIRSVAPNAKFGKVEGVGSEEFPPGVDSYNSPEERFISRTVEIEIRTIRN